MVSFNLKVGIAIVLVYLFMILIGIAAYNSGRSSLADEHCKNMGFDSGIPSSVGIVCYDYQPQIQTGDENGFENN